MTSRILIFDYNLRPLTELIGVPTTPRSWVLNDAGRCEFSISTSDPKCTEANFQFGNFVYVEHIPSRDAAGSVNGKLPAWVGIIAPPRSWDLGVLHVEAYSAESFLAFCPMPFEKIEGDPRSIFNRLLSHANAFIREYGGGAFIQPGAIDNKALSLSDDLRLSAREHIRTLATNAGMDWDVTGEINAKGNLTLYANLYSRKGIMTDLTLTNINSQVGSPLLTEQGNLSNVVIGYSQAATPQQRFKGVGRHIEAASDYGPMGLNVTFLGLRDASAVQTAAQERANHRGRPVKIISRTALDRQGTFDKLDTGNIVNIIENNAGFSPNGGLGVQAQARILSISFNDLSGNCPLNLEVI